MTSQKASGWDGTAGGWSSALWTCRCERMRRRGRTATRESSTILMAWGCSLQVTNMITSGMKVTKGMEVGEAKGWGLEGSRWGKGP